MEVIRHHQEVEPRLLSPHRAIDHLARRAAVGQAELGAIVRADFTFANVGGAVASGVRPRFALPTGVTHVPASVAINDIPITHGQSFIAINGATIGDLESNSQRRISISYRVNDLVEDGTTLAFQAALVSDQLPVTASNIDRITCQLGNELRTPSLNWMRLP